MRAFLLFVQRCCLQFHSHMYRARGNAVCIASIVTYNSRLCTRSFVKLRTLGWHYVRVLTTQSVYLCLRHCILMKVHFFSRPVMYVFYLRVLRQHHGVALHGCRRGLVAILQACLLNTRNTAPIFVLHSAQNILSRT